MGGGCKSDLRFIGEYASTLKEIGTSGCLNDSNSKILEAYYDYTINPDDYPADSVAAFPAHKNALVSIYDKKLSDRSNIESNEKRKAEKRTESSGSWLALLMLIPIGMSVFFGAVSNGGGISKNFSSKAKWIAITELVSILSIPLAITVMVMAPWYVGILMGLAILVLVVYNLFFGWFVKDYVSDDLKVKFPWIPAIIFGVFGALCIPAIATSVCIPLYVGMGNVDAELWKVIAGNAVSLGILILLGIWYRKSLYSRADTLRGSFWAIAIITIMAILSIFILIIVVIAFIIFKGSGKAVLSSGQGGSSTGGSSARSCSNCRHCNWNLTCNKGHQYPNASTCADYEN